MKKTQQKTTAETTLLHPPSKTESDRRAYIRSWLQDIVKVPTHAIRTEYPTSIGSIDLYLTNRRVVIEVKKDGRAEDPKSKGTGSREDESAFDQLVRYLKVEREREQLFLDDDIEDLDWIGVITDGKKWWIWLWDSYRKNKECNAKEMKLWQGIILQKNNISDLANILKRNKIVGKEWATADMTDEFNDVKDELLKLYNKRKGIQATKTQKGLWLEQLRGGGNEPETDIDKIFVLHTMLILISRLISNSTEVDQGFVQWVYENKESTVIDNIKERIEKYNWRQETGDILRALYEKSIPREHRLIYGEYYTPDWLAEKICQEMIDDKFLVKQIGNYNADIKLNGILDPSCGSGVFLYYAAKYILKSKYLQSFSNTEKKDFVLQLIHGIDIHPVAVEMARANIRRIFPNVEDQEIRIYQGDSLITEKPNAKLYGYDGKFQLVTPKGSDLILPNWFITSESDVSQFVKTACEDYDLPNNLGIKLTGYNFDDLKFAHQQLRDIVKVEKNGVWLWYILNQASPMKLQGTMEIIISNPPWVSFNKVQIASRKTTIKDLSDKCGLWIGGKYTSFDLATLFVYRCAVLYLKENGKSSWVLPYSAINEGGSWKKMYNKIGDNISAKWDMGNLPFTTNSCVLFFNTNGNNLQLIKKRGKTINVYDSIEIVESKTDWVSLPAKFPKEPSEWLNRSSKALARRGAEITPHCLTWISEKLQTNGDMITVLTKQSRWSPWKELGSIKAKIPKKWVQDTLSSHGLLPYIGIPNTSCILPIKDNDWDSDKDKNTFWSESQNMYVDNCGIGDNTSQTLEDCLNYNNKLFNQFKRVGFFIVYNQSGSILKSAIIKKNTIIHSPVISVPCSSNDEAYFLLGILNSNVMLPAFLQSRENDRHFAHHFWYKIPISRFDKNAKLHLDMVKYSKYAEKVAKSVYDQNLSPQRMIKKIKKALYDDGISTKIDDVCRELFPNHI